MKTHRQSTGVALIAAVVLPIAMTSSALAEIRNGNTPLLRVRVGPSGGVATVIYEAGIPTEMGSLAGVIAEPVTVSTNPISGGSGVFTVRFVTDVNAIFVFGATAPQTGRFFYNATTDMTCVTAPSCNGASIPLDRISWTARDSDTLNTVFRYSSTMVEEFQEQTDNDNANNGTDTRHRNWYQYRFDNDELLPAGTYEGTVTITGAVD